MISGQNKYHGVQSPKIISKEEELMSKINHSTQHLILFSSVSSTIMYVELIYII